MSADEELVTLEINGCRIGVMRGQDADHRHYLRLRPIDCVLEGEEPGLYYPVPILGEPGDGNA